MFIIMIVIKKQHKQVWINYLKQNRQLFLIDGYAIKEWEIYFKFNYYQNKMKRHSILLITGNPNKFRQFKQILGPQFQLDYENADLTQIQGITQEISLKKAFEAYNKFGRPVIVEDTALCFNAYKGLPGPYVKWFLQSIGTQGLAKMVQPFEDKTGYALCTISYFNKNLQVPKMFIGRTNGKIVPPRGSGNFGWDSIFQPLQSNLTYAEMSKQEKNTISHRFRAIQEMKRFFTQQNFTEQKNL